MSAAIIMGITSPVMQILLNAGLVAVVFVGAIRVDAGLSEVGKIIAFMSYFTIILNAMMAVTRLFVMCSKGIASMNRIAEVLDEKDEQEIFLGAAPSEDIDTDNKIVFDKVCFSYNGVKDNLHNISLSLKKGGTLGIIGATGSGKTTLIKLLMRFYDPQSGSIYIDGKDIRKMSSKELRSRFGVALQNDFLYAGTVEDNLRFEREVTTEEINEAVIRAQAGDFVNERGLDYQLDMSGHNLSGGQRQRLLVARALAGNPEILILDDASSALDYKTDSALRSAIGNIDPSPTTVIVAQRVSSVMNSDVILLLDNGETVACGDHETLMRECEMYREIAETQMGGGV